MKTIVITGASGGIGAAAARKMVHDGHRVVIVGRNHVKTEKIARELNADFYVADFAKLDEVNDLAEKLHQKYPIIDVLASNAGGLFSRKQEITADGHDMTFQVNYLAAYLLTRKLLPNLLRVKGTVIFTSSVGHKLFGKLDLNDLENKRNFDALTAYGNSKTELILLARQLNKLHGKDGLATATFHPGMIRTNIARRPGDALHLVYQTPLKYFWTISPERGAKTLVWLAESDHDDFSLGEYYVRCHEKSTSEAAHDMNLAEELWQKSEKILAKYLK